MLWERISQKSELVLAPRLLHAEEPLRSAPYAIFSRRKSTRLVINDREFFDRVQIVAGIISPSLRDKVELYDQTLDMFDLLGLDDAIRKSLERKVWMKNGGYIIIDQTEALTTIDVNTGKYVGSDNLQETITETNCEAAREIAKQLRLRDISGIIIVDFIDMDEIADKERASLALRGELAKDRTKSNVLGITQLGLVEMTRKKTRQCISNTRKPPARTAAGTEKVLSCETMLLRVRRTLMRCVNTGTAKHYLVRVH